MALRRPSSVSPFTIEEEKQISWVLDVQELQVNVNNFKPDVLAHFAWGGGKEQLRNEENVQVDNFFRLIFQRYKVNLDNVHHLL